MKKAVQTKSVTQTPPLDAVMAKIKRERTRSVKAAHASTDLQLLARCLYDGCLGSGERIEVVIDRETYTKLKAMGDRLCAVLDTGEEWGAEMIIGAALRNFFRSAKAGG